MGKILINCSNLKTGGGLQVADSVVCLFHLYSQHQFIIVLSSYMEETLQRLQGRNASNIRIVTYNICNNFSTIIRGRDAFLDTLIVQEKIDAVLTVFGPSRWNPKCKHLSGFAMPHLVLPESPFFIRMGFCERTKQRIRSKLLLYFFNRSAEWLWTENPYISERLQKLLSRKKIYTVSNCCNQVFDDPSQWCHDKRLPSFDGVTCLTISAYYAHKNFEILIDIALILKDKYPEFRFRFVLTLTEDKLPIPDAIRNHFIFLGKVDVTECPSLYEQSDIMLLPSLLECFSASYPEAMKMGVPIVTTDLEFAHGLCGDAACYYSAVDPAAAAEAIYKVATNKEYAAQLVANGKEQLIRFDNYEQRADKLITILEEIVNETGSNT